MHALIDTKEFQRLRRIRQLGLARFVYPGAEHSRFVHSLGVFNFARRMIEKLQACHAGTSTATELEENGKTIKAAALLHDLGHGPFSHVYERVFEQETKKPPTHEQWSVEIILDESTEVYETLVGAQIDPSAVAGLISDQYASGGRPGRPPAHPYLKDIVSSQLDADRMDYLLRDSLHTGSRYGQYDSEWILNALTIGKAKYARSTYSKLCLDASKGTGAIQGLLVARMLMTEHVYGHKAVRAYESRLLCTLRLALEYHSELRKETPRPVLQMLEKRGHIDVQSYLMLDDEVMWWALRVWATMGQPTDAHLRKPLAALKRHSLNLVRRRPPWKHKTLEKPEHLGGAIELITTLRNDNNPLLFECDLDGMTCLPYKDLMPKIGQKGGPEETYFKSIFLLRRDGSAAPMASEDAPVLGSLKDELRVDRFFYDRKYSEEFAGLMREFGVC